MPDVRPRITIIIPTFNSAETLPATIQSLRQQRFSALEVLVIDGGSSDGTEAVASAARDIVSDVISEPDKGIYDAINKGVERATGELIGVVGSDDVLCESALDLVYHFWRDARTDIVAGRAIMVSPDGGESLRIDEDFGPGALLTGIPFCHNAMFVTKEAYRRVGPYDLSYQLAADAQWTHRAIRMQLTCYRIEKPLVRFSLDGASTTRPAQTMAETFRLVSENFPGLERDDAEKIFREVRGWADAGAVEPIIRKHPADIELHVAIALAFQQRA